MSTNEIAIAGRVLRPGDEAYETERLPWQRKFDPRPALIVEASGPADVQAAIRMARGDGIPLAVQATGHGAVVPADGALLLKTGAMGGVTVDPQARTARAGAGAAWSDVIAAAAPHGLAPLSGTVASVGVAGYTLGGGVGVLARTYGFAADSLLRAELVTADGERVTASADEHPDLLWALRGGGGNFGVVCALEFRLHPAERVYAGTVMFDVERAPAILARYREWAGDEPDESNAVVVVVQVPPLPFMPEPVRGRRVVALRIFYVGDAAAGERLYAPLLEVAGEPLVGGLQETTFADAVAALGPPPPPSVGHADVELLHELSDDVVDVLADPAGPASMIELRHMGGAMARPGADAGPIGHRDVPYSAFVSVAVLEREQYPEAHAAVQDVTSRLRPHATGGVFLNFTPDPARTRSAFAEADYARLAEVKRAYDPENVFRRGHNIPPASGSS